MTNFTVLHLASPFSFSMPVPPKPPARPLAEINAADTADPSVAHGGEPLGKSGDDTVSRLANDAAASATGEAVFGSTFHDTVLRRYNEQGGVASGMGSKDAAPDQVPMP